MYLPLSGSMEHIAYELPSNSRPRLCENLSTPYTFTTTVSSSCHGLTYKNNWLLPLRIPIHCPVRQVTQETPDTGKTMLLFWSICSEKVSYHTNCTFRHRAILIKDLHNMSSISFSCLISYHYSIYSLYSSQAPLSILWIHNGFPVWCLHNLAIYSDFRALLWEALSCQKFSSRIY